MLVDYIRLKIVTECYYFQFMRFFFKYMLRCTRQKAFAAACDVRWICHAHCIAFSLVYRESPNLVMMLYSVDDDIFNVFPI